jgi:hypothetical protein
VRRALFAALHGVDRIVLLGDAVELRQGPLREALAVARPFFEELGAALGGDGEVVLVPGNHDHQLVEPWLERRRRDRVPPPLGLAEQAMWAPGDIAATLADWLAPARLTLSYPGIWLRDDVYATHGHYLDRHTTVPTFERLSAGVMARIVGALPAPPPAGPGSSPDDYEAALAPIYAWSYALAQHADNETTGTQGVSVRVWRTLAGDGHRPLRRRALAALFPLGIAAINRTGIGPVDANVSGEALGRAGVRAMADVTAQLRPSAHHVIFGHTHRAGPRPGDDPAIWTANGGIRLHNSGTWVFERHFVDPEPYASPYWPGHAIRVEDDPASAPRLVRLLEGASHAELSEGVGAV